MNDESKNKMRHLYQVQDELRRLKKLEGELRAEVVDLVITEDSVGSTRSELSDRMDIIVTVPTTISIDPAKFADHEASLRSRGLIGDNAVIVMKPSVSKTALKYMNEEDKVAFDSVFVHKKGTATVKFETKKD